MSRVVFIALLLWLSSGEAQAQTFEPIFVRPPVASSETDFGQAVLNLGDIDQNGFDDFVVGVPGYRDNDKCSQEGGSIWVLRMRTESEVLARTIHDYCDLGSSRAGFQSMTTTGNDLFSIGDIDGDGIPEFYVGQESGNSVVSNRMIVLVSLLENGELKDIPKARQIASLTSLGDLNDDGFTDFIGVRYPDNFNNVAGSIFFKNGSADSSEPEQRITSMEGITSFYQFGFDATQIGDLNGDTVPEVAFAGDNAIWVLSFDEGRQLRFLKEVRADDLGLPSDGSFGAKLESVDPTGLMPHLMVTSFDTDGSDAGVFLMAFDEEGDLLTHQFISSEEFPTSSDVDYRQFNIAVEKVDTSTEAIHLSLGLHRSAILGEDSGEVLRVVVERTGQMSRTATISGLSFDQAAFPTSFEGYARAGSDFNDDGIADLINKRFLYLMSEDGSIQSAHSLPSGSLFSHSIGDVNGDQRQDLAIAASLTQTSVTAEGTLSIYIQSSVRFGDFHTGYNFRNHPSSIMNGRIQAGDRFGFSAVSLGDVDGNGIDDLAIGAPRYPDAGGPVLAKVFVAFMNADGTPSEVTEFEIEDGNDRFTESGMHLSAMGDIDSDGVPDLAIGFPSDGRKTVQGRGSGAVHVVLLTANGGIKSKSVASFHQGSDIQFIPGSEMGWIAAVDDVDGNGVRDLVVGPGVEATGETKGILLLMLDTDGSVSGFRQADQFVGPYKDLFSQASSAGQAPGAFRDMDGDGLSEIIVRYAQTDPFTDQALILSLAPLLSAEIEATSVTPEIPDVGEAVTISTSVRPFVGSEVSKVKVLWRPSGFSRFFAQQMTPDSVVPESWETTIVKEFISEKGIEYYIVASSVGRADQLSPARGYNTLPVGLSTSSTIFGGTAEAGYLLRSVPAKLDQADAFGIMTENFGKYDASNFRMFTSWQADSEIRQEGVQLEPGDAFWMISRQTVQMKWGWAQTVPTDTVFAITLPQGWSTFGAPFNFGIDPSLIVTGSGNSSPDIRRYDGGWTSHTGLALEPFEGYAIRNNTDSEDVLYIAPSKEIADLNEHFRAASAKSTSTADWSIPIHARMGLARDTDNFAVAGSSDFDRADPPPIGDYVRLAFEGSEYPLSTAARSLDANLTEWVFKVSSEKAGAVLVQFPDLSEVPPEYGITLVDPASGIRQNLRESSSYVVVSSGAGSERTLRLELDANGFTEAALPTELRLNAAFPNPFSSSTTLQYALPESGSVELEIFDILGRRIAMVDSGEKNAGNHVRIWDGRASHGQAAAPGVYIARFKAGGTAQTITITKTH